MTANMLTEGTKTRSAQDIARQTEALGALSSGRRAWKPRP
jgi:zinc protease